MHVVRASKIGHPCIRNIWLNNIAGIPEEFSVKTLRKFDMGNAVEELVVKWLRQDGWMVYHNEGSQQAEWEISVEIKGGVIKGHPDGFMMKDGEALLPDFKSMGAKYRYWIKEGTLKSSYGYYQQLLVYGGATGWHNLALVGVKNEDGEYTIERLPWDWDAYQYVIDKAEYVASLTEPPIPDTMPMFGKSSACGYCSYKDMGVCPGFKGLEGME